MTLPPFLRFFTRAIVAVITTSVFCQELPSPVLEIYERPLQCRGSHCGPSPHRSMLQNLHFNDLFCSLQESLPMKKPRSWSIPRAIHATALNVDQLCRHIFNTSTGAPVTLQRAGQLISFCLGIRFLLLVFLPGPSKCSDQALPRSRLGTAIRPRLRSSSPPVSDRPSVSSAIGAVRLNLSVLGKTSRPNNEKCETIGLKFADVLTWLKPPDKRPPLQVIRDSRCRSKKKQQLR